MGVGTLRTGLVFPRWLIWGVTRLGLVEKWTVFHLSSLETPEMCIETVRTGFVFTRQLFWGVTWLGLLWKMNVFPSISLESPEMSVETVRTGFIFLKMIDFGGSHGQVYLKNWTFSHPSPWKLHKCVLKPSEQGLFFQDDQFEGSQD